MSDNRVKFNTDTTNYVWTNVRGYGNLSVNDYSQSVPLALQKKPETNCKVHPWNRIPSLNNDNFTLVDRTMAWSNPSISPWWDTDFYGYKSCDRSES